MREVRARSGAELCQHYRWAQAVGGFGSWEWSVDEDEMWWSEETFALFELDPEIELPTPQAFWSAIHPDDHGALRIAIGRALDDTGRFEIECRLAGESERFALIQGAVASDSDRSNLMCGIMRDITGQRVKQKETERLANYDSLTGLANRRHFLSQLSRSLEEGVRDNYSIGLLYMDLDGFKRVNDTLGHAAGDLLLREVAARLRTRVRGADVVSRLDKSGTSTSVSRLGGDEFTILLTRLEDPERAELVARRILKALADPIRVEGQDVFVTGSIGIAVHPQDGRDSDTLLKHADTAMYHAKSQGRNGFKFFSPEMNARAMRRLSIEGRLRRALEHEELELHYQPKLDIATGKVVAAEALLRWQSEALGNVSPREVIPIAEETGLIGPIGRWAIEQACRQARIWSDNGFTPVPIAVNVSSRQFVSGELIETATDALRGADLDPSALELEITESILLQDDDEVATILRDLRAIGIRIALDDFGTGYSSLSYLTRFPLDTLKLDRAFVRDIDDDPSALHVVRAVVNLAHGLGLVCVAEGVDSEAQLELLREMGCDQMQGFLVSPAVVGEEFEMMLSR